MKYLLFASLAIVLVLVASDEESIADKLNEYLNSAHKEYKDQIDSVKKTVDKIKEKATATFNDDNFSIDKKIDGIMSAIREKRSPQTYPENAKSPAEQAVDNVQDAYNDLRDKVSSFFGNVSNSEVVSDVKSHLDKFKNTLQDAGKHIKSTIHNITSPTDESKESKESN